MTKEEIKEHLRKEREAEYALFQQKLLPGVENITGVRLPKLHRLAKKILKENASQYLQKPLEDSFEENMLEGFIIGGLKEDIKFVLVYIEAFLPKINNWSVCDSFCSSLKIAKDNQKEMWDFLLKCIASKQTYYVRFAIVMMIFYFIEDRYIKEVILVLDKIRSEEYYINMALAWALSIAYIKQERITEDYLINPNGLSVFVYQKTIQKIIESRQVTAKQKEKIRTYIKNKGMGEVK